MEDIDRRSHLPLYVQLKEMLLENFRKGVWKPGDKIPTEGEIQNEYNLSRTTVRQALRELELEGRIQRQAGRGTFVSQPKIQEGTEAFNLGLPSLVEQGLQVAWKIMSAGEVAAPEAVVKMLQLAPGERVFCLERLRLLNDEIIGYAVTYVAPQFSPKIDLSLALVDGTMNYLTPIGLEQCTAERVVEALLPDRQDIRLLKIDRYSPVLVITRLLRTGDGQPVEYYRGVSRGDRFRYHIQKIPAEV